jgi:hypothetical protein
LRSPHFSCRTGGLEIGPAKGNSCRLECPKMIAPDRRL